MPLVGNLRDFALHDFLYLVDRGYKSGSLLLDRPAASDAAHLYFHQGKLVTALRPHRRERLGELLIRLGKITPTQLELALQAQQMGNHRLLGQILVEQGAIDQRELQACVQRQIEDTVYDLFGWHEGEFTFQLGQHPAPDDVQALVPLPIENLIMEGVRRVDELSRIRERIPSDDMRVRFVDRPLDSADRMKLTADEWRVFARINGTATIKEIAEQTGVTTFQVSDIVFGFINRGLVEVEQPEAAPVLRTLVSNEPIRLQTTSSSAVALELPEKGLMNRLMKRVRGA